MSTNNTSYVADPQAVPVIVKTVAAADAAVGAAGTYVTAVSLALPPGMYHIFATVQYLNGAGAAFVNGKLLNGTIIEQVTEDSCIATGSVTVHCHAVVNVYLAAGATVAFQVTSTTATGSIKAALANGGANTGATAMQAVRIK